jgi:hypothetical protein
VTFVHYGTRVLAAVGSSLLSIALASSVTAGPRADDLEHAKSEYVLKSQVFSPEARGQAVRFIDAIAEATGGMTREQFLLSVLRIAAFADNGHDTESDEGDAWWPAARLPVRMLWFPDAWVIARADSANADLLGARVLSIDNRLPGEVFRGLRDLWGGVDAYRRWNLERIVEHEGLLHAAGLARHADRLRLELQLVDGRRIHRTLKFVPKTALPAAQILERVWSPAPWPGEAEKGWHAFDPKPTPLYLQDGARLFRVVRVPELQALFIQMRVHFDMDGETVADFRHKVDGEIDEYHPRHLIVDLRFDTGGNIDETRDWQRALPARVPGRVYVLVGRYTFSAGIVAAAAFKHDAPQQVRLVGEGVGDRLRWWSEGHNVCMPDSHYCLHLTTGLWDLVNGCAERPECYGDKYDARVVDLFPDLDAPLTLTSWVSGRDPGMEAIERDLSSADGPRVPSGR